MLFFGTCFKYAKLHTGTLRAAGLRRVILDPVPNRPQQAFTRSYNRKPTAVKDHKTHVLYPVNKAQAGLNGRWWIKS